MSYFGAPAPSSTISSSGRPTKPLASIPRKTSPPRQPPPTASTLLAQTLAKLKPVAAAASAVEPVPAPASAPPKTTKKPNKKGFVVKFRDDTGTGDLEEVKLFTQAEHEHELAPWQEDLQGVSMHQMDVSEGSALKHHEEMEEEVEWYEPYGELTDGSKGGAELTSRLCGYPRTHPAHPGSPCSRAAGGKYHQCQLRGSSLCGRVYSSPRCRDGANASLASRQSASSKFRHRSSRRAQPWPVRTARATGAGAGPDVRVRTASSASALAAATAAAAAAAAAAAVATATGIWPRPNANLRNRQCLGRSERPVPIPQPGAAWRSGVEPQ